MTDWQAGPELDAEIARRVFDIDVLGLAPCHNDPECGELSVGKVFNDAGLRPVFLESCGCEFYTEPPLSDIRDEPMVLGHHLGCLGLVPEYSTDIGAAWLVIEKMREMGWRYTIFDGHTWLDGPLNHCVTFTMLTDDPHNPGAQRQAMADSLPLAVCRAAPSALEVLRAVR